LTSLDRVSIQVTLSVVVRLAGKADLSRLEWYGQYTHYRNVLRRVYREQLQGRRLILVAACNDFPIGQIFIQFNSGNRRIADGAARAYFSSFRIMEMFQGQGIGTRLITEAEHVVADRGFRWATIAAAKDNPGALRLYERLGYRIFGDDPGRWNYLDHRGYVRKMQEPCWVLEKDLHIS
jgi:ribosomal protein S18 acetylase RimI-like enzyme